MKNISYDAVVVASGKGKRSELNFNKVFYPFPDGETVLQKAIRVFQEDSDCQRIIVVLTKDEMHLVEETDKIILCEGGKERMDSVYHGLQKTLSPYVMVHDGARPYLQEAELTRLKKALQIHDAAILSLAVRDSLKYGQDNIIKYSLARENIYLAQTPQAFRKEILMKAYALKKEEKLYTDEASLCEELGIEVSLVKGSWRNIKITYPEDLPR